MLNKTFTKLDHCIHLQNFFKLREQKTKQLNIKKCKIIKLLKKIFVFVVLCYYTKSSLEGIHLHLCTWMFLAAYSLGYKPMGSMGSPSFSLRRKMFTVIMFGIQKRTQCVEHTIS